MHDEPARPKRLSLSEILEMVLTRQTERSTVALSRTSSGDVVIDVKVSAESVAQAGEQAQAELERLEALYPRTVATHEPTISLTRNAKGETQIDVKSTGVDRTIAEYDKARAKYPMANGATAKPGTVT